MNNLNDLTERFLEVYERLLLDKKVANLSDFAKKVGISNSMMTEIVKRRSNVGIKVIQNTVNTFDMISPDWIITGRGKMTEFFIPEIKYSKNADEEWAIKTHGTPLIPSEAFAGLSYGNITILEADIKEYYYIPDFTDVDFMIRIKGDSMAPNFNSGDVIACKKIQESKFIQWNKVHVIATKEQGVLIKRLKKSQNKNCLIAISDNINYDPFEIPSDEILNLAIVIGVVRLV